MKNNLKLILTTATVGLALSSCIGGQTSPVSKSGQLISSSEVGSLVIPAVMQGTYNAVLTQSSALNESTIAYNKASIAKEAGFGQLVSDTFIATGAVARGVAGMQQYDITYYTNGANANQDVTQVNRTVSGAVYVPLDASGKVLTAKGVVVFFHPTTPIKNLVPSCYLAGAVITPSYCDSGYESAAANIYASSTGYKAIASMYTSQGYIVVMPDYVGQGIDTSTVHPYVVYPEVNAADGINMLSAARTLLTTLHVESTVNLNLFATGFSEGGAYALKLAQISTQQNYANQLTSGGYSLKMVSPVEGAYDLVNQMKFEFANLKDGILNTGGESVANMVDVDLAHFQFNLNQLESQVNPWRIVNALNAASAKPILGGYALIAYGYYDQHNLTTAYNTIMQNSFWSGIPVAGFGSYSLPQLFSSSQPFNFTLNIVAQALSMFNQTNKTTYGNAGATNTINYNIYVLGSGTSGASMTLPTGIPARNNSVEAFVPSAVISNPLFTQVMIDASVLNFKPAVKVNLISMAYDSVVPYINTQNAYASLSAIAPSMVESVIINNAPLTNNMSPYLAAYFTAGFTGSAVSKFFTSDSLSQVVSASTGKVIYSPIDHSSDNTVAIALLPSLCAFEHYESSNWGSNMTNGCLVN